MALSNNCGVSSSSPFCKCTDYYGNMLPELRAFDDTAQTFTCCDNLTEFVSFTGTTLIDGDNNLVTFYNNSTSDSCNQLNGVQTNGDLKNKYPLIYYQALLNASLFSHFTAPQFTSANSFICVGGKIPYMVSYPNYNSPETNYKVLCGDSNTINLKEFKFLTSSIEIPYTINYITNADGSNCTTSECGPKYSIYSQNEYNIGDLVYRSGGSIESESLLMKWWFWFIILIVILIMSFGFYYLYYSGMGKYFERSVEFLNSVTEGLGDTAKKHGKKIHDSHFHLNA